ncbi:MAG: hypothetical protein JW727_03560 [Candidatus Aenigmarchaeota archaeon]|nr:hypothetical protein [Candidatus Aenigmarchaeota archaeon]
MTNGTAAASSVAGDARLLAFVQGLADKRKEKAAKIDSGTLKTIQELSWSSDDFVNRLFSVQKGEVEMDPQTGKVTIKPRTESVLSLYDNGTSLFEVGQYVFGVPIAWFGTKLAQEAYIQDVAGGLAFKTELEQLSRTVEDYLDTVLFALQWATPEAPKKGGKSDEEIAKSAKELLAYKGQIDTQLKDLYGRLEGVEKGVYASKSDLEEIKTYMESINKDMKTYSEQIKGLRDNVLWHYFGKVMEGAETDKEEKAARKY